MSIGYGKEPQLNDPKFDPRVRNGSEVRFISPRSRRFLSASDPFYKQKQISEYKEVFGSENFNEQGIWYIYVHPTETE